MKPQLFSLLFLLTCFFTAQAQKQVKGGVKDTNGKAVASANITLKDKEGNILTFSRSNDKGQFSLTLPEDTKGLSMEVTIIGYAKKSVTLNDLNKTYEIILQEEEINLKTVIVKQKPTLIQKGDTLNYRTSDFADKSDRSIGDVLRKMPGIDVAENGKISYNGKNISNLYMDKDNLLDDKYGIATKAIPHDAIEKVQVIENDQPIKMLQKNNMSDDVALNLVFKDEAKVKVMGELKAGLGTPERFDGNANAMLFNKKVKFINNVKGNNIGTDPGIDLTSFNMSDYMRKVENDKPGNFLSAGAAGVPTLPQSRTLFNRAGLANLNNLFKINEDLQVRVNFGYLYDHRTQEYNKLSETYLPTQTIRYDESQQNMIIPQKLQSKLNLNSNAENYYLNNNLTIDYTPYFIKSATITNGTSANQSLNQRNFEIANEFNYRKKLKSENSINFYSFLSKSNQPELLKIRPGINEDILNNGSPYNGLNQEVKLPAWFTHNYASMGFAHNRFTQFYKTGFTIQQQELISALYRLTSAQNEELVSNQMTNGLTWTKAKFYTDASYEYSGEKVKASLSVPLNYQNIHYEDPSKMVDKTLNRLFVSPSFNIKYDTGPENYLSANYAYRDEPGGLSDIYSGTILKNYRTLFSNNAPISERKTHQAGASFSLKKAMKMLFVNAGINYTYSTLNTISSYNLGTDIQERIVLPLENHVEALNTSISLSKYLFALRSTLNLGFNYGNTQFQQLQNQQLLPFISNSYSWKGGMETKITSFINWSYSATYNKSVNSLKNGSNLKTRFQQIRQSSGINVTAFKKVFMNLSAEHIFTHQAAQPNLSYLFADLNLRYRVTKYKTDLEFGLKNLTNIKKFEDIFLSANAMTNGTYYIPGRIAMLKATFNF